MLQKYHSRILGFEITNEVKIFCLVVYVVQKKNQSQRDNVQEMTMLQRWLFLFLQFFGNQKCKFQTLRCIHARVAVRVIAVA